MHRYLVVANQTLSGGALVSKLRELAAEGPCSFHVLVPATPPHGHMYSEGEARAIAEQRLHTAFERFRDLGAEEITGEVGDEHPMYAISEVMQREAFDTIVLSTLPPKVSKWLKLDLVHRVRGTFDLPVIHVTGQSEPARA